MEAFDYKLYDMVVKLHPNASKEVLLAEYAKHLQIKQMIENSTYTNNTPVLDVTPSQISGKKQSKKVREYKTYKKNQLKMGKMKDTLEAIKDDTIICLLCGNEMKTLGRHLYSEHQCSVSNYKQICGYEEDLILAGKKRANDIKENIKAMKEKRMKNKKKDK